MILEDAPFTARDAQKVSQSMGEMPQEQAVAHAREVKALLQKASSVFVSGSTVRVTPEGKLEIAYGGNLIYIEAKDIELLQEQCVQAIRARENYDVNRVTDGIVTPAPTDVSAMAGGRTANYVPGVEIGRAHV